MSVGFSGAPDSSDGGWGEFYDLDMKFLIEIDCDRDGRDSDPRQKGFFLNELPYFCATENYRCRGSSASLLSHRVRRGFWNTVSIEARISAFPRIYPIAIISV